MKRKCIKSLLTSYYLQLKIQVQTLTRKKACMNTLLSKKSISTTDGFKGRGVKIRLIGLEPIIFGTEIQRSIQLSYKRKRNDSTTNNFKSSG